MVNLAQPPPSPTRPVLPLPEPGAELLGKEQEVNYKEVKERLLQNPKVADVYANPPESLTFARYVVERRKAQGMTQQELATKAGTSQAQIWRIESGHFNPTARTMQRIKVALA